MSNRADTEADTDRPHRWGHLLLTLVLALVLAIALRHVSMDACLQDLRRNPALRLLIGIEAEDAVPDADNMSRFLARLGEEPHLSLLRAGPAPRPRRRRSRPRHGRRFHRPGRTQGPQ